MRASILISIAALAWGCAGPREAARSRAAPELATAEAFVDAFYSFDPARLRKALAAAPRSAPRLLYYQGWAEGGGYVVLERGACRIEKPGEVVCAIKVRDGLIAALGTGYDVTDKFHFDFREGRIVEVRNSSDDPPDFAEALKWLAGERPDLMTGPCRGFFDGGPTPQDCARAVIRGFADFAARRRN